ncbi:MAG: hypothetical protein NUW01_00400 [Gemmatimonadaceae bacterium]|nr:hypothetical protein [Gemmatimonadaceae bacterium]
MRLESTGATAGQWLLLSSTGDLFAVPDSTAPLNQKFIVASDMSPNYFGFIVEPYRGSGGSTGVFLATSTGAQTTNTLYFNGIVYEDLVTNGVNYLYLLGSSSGGHPDIAAFGVDTDVDVTLQPKGAGAVRLNQSAIALGGGAAATLGTIGGSGPGTAGQAYWMEIHIAASTARYFLPVWST